MSESKHVYISRPLKLDDAGLPLVPQPTDSPSDPLNYPRWLKFVILAQVCCLAFLATLSSAMVGPSRVVIAEDFNIPPLVATYQSTAVIGAGAFGPLIYRPIANVYGRRPAYLISMIIGLASAVGSATAPTFSRLVVSSMFNGIGPTAATALGAGSVTDLFYGHHRGRAMGLFIFCSSNGGHLAEMIGGYISRARGWRWCYWVAALLNATFFIIALFCMPETIFDRESHTTSEEASTHDEKKDDEQIETVSVQDGPYEPPHMTLKIYLRRMWFWDLDRPASRVVQRRQFFIKPLSMLKYPSVAIPVFYLMIAHAYSTSAPSVSFSVLFTKLYHFDPARNGLAAGLSLLLGSALGELCSGTVTDAMMRRAKKRAYIKGETVPAELRLKGIWAGAIAAPIGMLIYGFTLHYVTTFIAPCIGIAVACFGIQIVLSVCYTYSCGDCYRHRSNDVAMCYNFCRALYSMPLSFYVIPLGDKIGFQWTYTLFAAFSLLAFIPVIVLMFRGEKWRKAFGEPPL